MTIFGKSLHVWRLFISWYKCGEFCRHYDITQKGSPLVCISFVLFGNKVCYYTKKHNMKIYENR